MDYFGARYYSSSQGRFTSADEPFADQRPANGQSWNLYTYVQNNPCNMIDPNGKCSAPSGLKAGQVGICFEAFIQAKSIGVGGLGKGDNRSFTGNDPSKPARVTVWVIVSTDGKQVNAEKSDDVSPSKVLGFLFGATGQTDVKFSNNNTKVGEKDFGQGIDITVSISEGKNGVQTLGEVFQSAGVGMPDGDLYYSAGKSAELLSPPGTIDGNVTLRITGSGEVTYLRGESRGFPSYAVYSYTVDANGNIQTTEQRRREENKVEDLTKPMTPF